MPVRQADARAPARPRHRTIDLVEAIKQKRQMLGRDADTGVAHGENGLARLVLAHRQRDRAAVGGELEGIREQVQDDGLELLGVEDVGERLGLGGELERRPREAASDSKTARRWPRKGTRS